MGMRPLRWADPAMTTAGFGGAMSLPAGTVSFLLTDIESSTLMWQMAPDAMAAAVERHYEILDVAISAHGGVRPEEQGEGDSVVAAFSRASDAVGAALDAQRALLAESWPTPGPVQVRMAVHTGEARLRDEANYVGMSIIRTARLRNIAHGGQVLVSSASRDLALDQMGDGLSLLDLGEHRLKDLARPERVFQLVHPALPGVFGPLRSLDATPNNLPVRLSAFIGRRDELVAVEGLVSSHRLVTVMGAGGAGKTRLALQTAAELADRFPDGVWWVELASLPTGGDVGPVLAGVLNLVLDETTPAVEALCRRFADDRALVVMDNCEHVLDSAGDLVSAVLQRCPNVTVLATSRGLLDVPGEVTWRIPPLSLPAVGASVPIARLAQFDAVRLFIDGARRARPTFALTDDNAPAVAEICQRLDGIPLAIELASARTKSLTPTRILEGLGDALRLLTGGSRMSVPRQQTLEASIGWSVALLADRERVLLARLSVFAGSFDLDAAEVVTVGDELDAMEVLDSLERLIDHSLVSVVDGDDAGRFMLLETVRQYGARLLDASGDLEPVRRRHAHHFADLVGSIAPLVETSGQFAAIARLDAEHPNITAALVWFEQSADTETLAEVACALNFYWYFTGRQLESIRWFSRTIDLLPERPSVWRARLLADRANARYGLGGYLASIADAQAAVEMGAAVDDPLAEGRGCWVLAAVFSYVDVEQYWPMSDRTIELLERAGDGFALAEARFWRAVPVVMAGVARRGKVELQASWPAVEALGNPNLIATHLTWQATVATHEGRLTDAQVLIRRCLDIRLAGGKAVAQWQTSHARLVWATISDCVGADDPSIDDLDRWHDDAVRAGELAAANNYALARVTRTLAVDRERAAAIAIEVVANDLGFVPLLGSINHGIASWAVLGVGDADRALELAAIATELAQASHNAFVLAAASIVPSLVLAQRGEFVAAETHARTAIALTDDNGLMHLRCLALEGLAVVSAAAGDLGETGRILGATASIRREMGLVWPHPALDDAVAAAAAAARHGLGTESYDEAFAAGAALNGDEIVAYVNRARGDRRRPNSGWDSLTPTEWQVIDLVATGQTNREVATQLLMGAETVKTHLSHIFTKLGINNRAQLAAAATSRAAASGATTR